MPKLRLTYNAPVVLTFTILAVVVQVLVVWIDGDINSLGESSILKWFACSSELHETANYFGVVTHILGHADWQHLFGNFAMILLLGPILEERYGGFGLLVMMFVTALITGLIQVIFFSNQVLVGASGIVFMFILLASVVNSKQREIPLTFVLVALLYLGTEVAAALKDDNVSQLAHIVGGIAGSVFGFIAAPSAKKKEPVVLAQTRTIGSSGPTVSPATPASSLTHKKQ